MAASAGSVTKATPIPFIDSKSHIKKWRGRKTALSGYYTCLSRDLLLMASRADTHTHTNVHGRNDFKKPGLRAPVLKISNNVIMDYCIGRNLAGHYICRQKFGWLLYLAL